MAKGKGANLSLPQSPALTLPVRARLIRGDGTPACWEATFSSHVSKNDAVQFKAKSD